MLTDIIALSALCLHALGAIAAMHAVVHARTPQGAMAWALGLVLLPYVTLVPYLYLGSSQVHGYLETPRRLPGAPPVEAGTHPACLRLDALATHGSGQVAHFRYVVGRALGDGVVEVVQVLHAVAAAEHRGEDDPQHYQEAGHEADAQQQFGLSAHVCHGLISPAA